MHVEQQQAARAVHAVLGGATLRAALAAVDDGSALRGRTLVAELAYGTLRHWGTLDALVRRLADKGVADPLLGTLLAVAIYQLEHTRAPAFAVVDRAVEAAAELARPAAKRWANALLRRYLRERTVLGAAVRADPVARYSYPRWWIARVKADHPDHWMAILEAGNARPPLTLRVNLRAGTVAALLARFAAADVRATAAGSQGILVDPPVAVAGLPGYAEGAFSVQDLGAQLAAPLLGVTDGLRVLDACAAPGGKSAQILESASVDLLALDRDAARLPRLRENLARLGLAAEIRVGDAIDPKSWWDGRPFERILLDAPCSATGIIRRQPDIKLHRRATDIGALAKTQARLLDALWPLLKPGGRLVYATCSVLDRENTQQIDDFLRRHADARALPAGLGWHARGSGEVNLPGEAGMDGFFYAVVEKHN